MSAAAESQRVPDSLLPRGLGELCGSGPAPRAGLGGEEESEGQERKTRPRRGDRARGPRSRGKGREKLVLALFYDAFETLSGKGKLNIAAFNWSHTENATWQQIKNTIYPRDAHLTTPPHALSVVTPTHGEGRGPRPPPTTVPSP